MKTLKSTYPVPQWSRRTFVTSALAGGLSRGDLRAATPLTLPLRNAAGLSIDGPHRFLKVGDYTGFQPTSLGTRAQLTTDLHRARQGTLRLWFSPLEDLDFSPPNHAQPDVAFEFPFLSDTFPGRAIDKMRFGAYYSASYPAIMAKFASGGIWQKLDRGLAPFVYVERAPLRAGYWYQLALTWDRAARKLVIYLNGMMAGHNLQADNFEEAAPQLYLGNPMIVLRDLHIEDRVSSAAEIQAGYRNSRAATNDVPDADFRRMLFPGYGPALDPVRDASWRCAYDCPFTSARDLDGWVRQGPGEKYVGDFRMETTPEGLYLKTPDRIENDTRMYLWSKRSFEGDQWIEFDFRLESPKGLALLVACASGMQREDSIADHGVPATGGMGTILRDLRNYHWEYVRRVEAMRTDVETQYVSKNPFTLRMHYSCIPRLEQQRWYRLRFIKAGARLHGSLNGQTVFDITDHPFENNGPVYNYGRIGLRQMYHTAMRYRYLRVYQR